LSKGATQMGIKEWREFLEIAQEVAG
jgi:hypothetical protein